MKYKANPVVVEAFEIADVGEVLGDGSVHVALRNGLNVTADSGMISRYMPIVGDYWVIQEDGYQYINPKLIFERKYSKLEQFTLPGRIQSEKLGNRE